MEDFVKEAAHLVSIGLFVLMIAYVIIQMAVGAYFEHKLHYQRSLIFELEKGEGNGKRSR